VDAIITLDLVHHSDNHSFDWDLLLAGDNDLVEAVRHVQHDGRRLLIAIPSGAGMRPSSVGEPIFS
jgi:uncharacterized LabA/DUF88 family protein